MRLTKVYDIASFKALPDQDGKTGRFEAIVSVFGNVDYQGDRVMPGAFEKSLETWRASGDPIPIIWSHEWGDPFAHIGFADPNDVEEVTSKAGMPAGLLLRGQLDVHKPFAAQVYDLMKDRRVREFSFAYDVEDEKMAADKANELRVLSLIEAGPTLKGANPDTVSIDVKSRLDRAAKLQFAADVLKAAENLDPELAKMLNGGQLADDLETLTSETEVDAELLAIAMGLDPELAKALVGTPTSDPAEGSKNVYEPLAGSDEERRGWVSDAVNVWGEENYPRTDSMDWGPYVCIAATYPDHVLAAVEQNDEETQYFEIPYTVDAEGVVTLGDASPVTVEVTVTAAKAAKAAGSKTEGEAAEEPLPADETAFRAHLGAAAPGGHAMDSEEIDAILDDVLASHHEGMHGSGDAGHTHPDLAKAIDEGDWDGAAAMASCDNAADFAKIAFRRADDELDSDTAAAWALPHHSSPGADANAKGVSSAVGAMSGARGGAPDLKDSAAAKAHLAAHEAEIAAAADGKATVHVDVEFELKAGRVIGAKALADVKAAISATVDEWAASVNVSAEADTDAGKIVAPPDPEADADLKAALAKLTSDGVPDADLKAALAKLTSRGDPDADADLKAQVALLEADPVHEVIVIDGGPDADLKAALAELAGDE